MLVVLVINCALRFSARIFAIMGGLEPPTFTRHRRHLSSSDAIWYCFRLLSALYQLSYTMKSLLSQGF